MTKDILFNHFNDLHSLKFYDAQLTEHHLLIINLMRQEFQQCLFDHLNKNSGSNFCFLKKKNEEENFLFSLI